MTEDDERRYLEQVVRGKAKPTLGPVATLGRLAQLYLSSPDRVRMAPTALSLLQSALVFEGTVARTDPLYPKLHHFEAMAMRLVDQSARAKAAAIDRDAWQVSLETAPAEAILLAAEWGDWAWDQGFLDEAGEAYENAHRSLRRFLLRRVEERDRLDVMHATQYATRGAFALASTGQTEQALTLLERAADLVFSANVDRELITALQITDPALASRLVAAMERQAGFTKPPGEKFGLDAFGNLSSEALEAQRVLDEIVFEIRKRPGFARFA